MTQLRGAVIGCGRMGAFTSKLMLKWAPIFWHPLSHCEAIATHPNVDLVAVCDIDIKQIERVQKKFLGVSGFYNFKELIDNVKPDILGVATRTNDRTRIIEYAEIMGVRGLHLEKPLCNSVIELESIARIFESSKLVCTYGTLRRYLPIFLRARDLVRSGRFGPLLELQACFGSAPLMWSHPHSFDLLSFFAEDIEITSVSAHFKDEGVFRQGAFLDGDPIVKSVTIEFASGVTGLITQAGGHDVILTCRDGSVTVESGARRIRCRESLGEGDPYWDSLAVDDFVGSSGGTALAIERLVLGIRDQTLKSIVEDKNAILAGQRALFASVQSHIEAGRAVSPRNLDPNLRISGRNSLGKYA
jgi:scyllo-inositol 2-dehydrogenase (NAD+)